MYLSAKMDSLVLVITFLTGLLLILLPVGILTYSGASLALALPLLLCPLILVLTYLYQVTGIKVNEKEVVIIRRIGNFIISRESLISAKFIPNAMNLSIRTFGNGGLFGFYGSFRNSTLGSYRAFVTSRENTVVLKSSDQTYVVSPQDPQAFVNELS